MSNEIESLYQDIRANLETSRNALMTTTISEDLESSGIRSLTDAEIVLGTLEFIALETKKLLDVHASLESLFEKSYGKVREVYDREAIVETSLIEDFLFPVTTQCALNVDGEFSREVTESYKEIFKAWVEDKTAKHVETQEQVKTNFDIKLNDKDLSCQCVQCLGDYRTQVREYVFEMQTSLIDKTEERLQDLVLERRISDVSAAVFNLKKDLDKNFHNMRNKLKRSSVNKLERDRYPVIFIISAQSLIVNCSGMV